MKKTAKQLVISSLIEEKALSIDNINKKIKEKYQSNLSYHSIYKALQELTKKEVLIKEKNKFHLSKKWMINKILFANKLRDHINHTRGMHYDTHSSSIIEFNNTKELHLFLRRFEDDHLDIYNKEVKSNMIWIVRHCYNLLLQPSIELEHTKKIKEHNNNFLISCYGNTLLDNWAKKSYERFGTEMITNSKIGGISSLNIYDNFVVQIFYGKNFCEILDKTYNEIENITDLDISKIFEELHSTDYKIYVMIYKNKGIVESFKKKALKLIKKNKEK